MTVTIAVIDDDDAVLDALKLVLEDEGWQVRGFSTGEAFLADPNGCASDCVILDPHLPGLRGPEVARALAQSDCHSPIIGLTARPDSPVALEMLDMGIRVLLRKPISAEDLFEHVREAIHDSDGRPG